jgi:predicted DNA-binding transcriptional regulator YafY
MFERDKEDLRDLGVPLVTGSNSAWDDEIGYRITRSDYALPDISLDPDEASALALAARLWSSASLAGASISALRKLQAAGVDSVPPPPGLEPRVDAREPAFEPLLDAVRDGRAVRFPYRRPPETDPRERTSSPGASCRGTGTGTSSATTATATTPECSGSPGSPDRCARSGRQAQWCGHRTWTCGPR